MARDITVTPVAVAVHRVGDSPIFGESMTHIRVEDDAAGPYIVISQPAGREAELKPGELAFDADELPVIYRAAMRLLKQQAKEA